MTSIQLVGTLLRSGEHPKKHPPDSRLTLNQTFIHMNTRHGSVNAHTPPSVIICHVALACAAFGSDSSESCGGDNEHEGDRDSDVPPVSVTAICLLAPRNYLITASDGRPTETGSAHSPRSSP